MIARFIRMIPMVVLLAVIAGVVYFVAQYRYSPERAKEILIKWFSRITLVFSAALAIFSLYVYLDGSAIGFEIAIGFLIVALVGFGITQLCRFIFLKHHPEYRHKPMKTSKEHRIPWK